MKQVVQSVSGGPVRVVEVPAPVIGPTEVLVRTVASVMSPGTERAVVRLAQSSLLAKARGRPDLVRQVVRKARTEGLVSTAGAVRTRLDDELPLGYSAAGIVLEVGEAVAGVAPGQLVATGGAGKANHAELQAVPGLLCAAVPDGVPAEDAAFATIASVALHGLRLADVGPGAKVVVLGLGLVGQLALRLAQAAGCDVAGIDVGEFPVERARAAGGLAFVDAGEDTTKAVREWTRGRGADAVLVAAASRSSTLMARVPELCRDGATIVVVGDVGLELDRRPFYERELTIRFARSYGPGRYERSYEDWGVDVPPGLLRWTEGRNLEAVLDLVAGGRLAVADLVTHSFDIQDAPAAYEVVESRSEPYLAVAFRYPGTVDPRAEIQVRPRPERRTAVPGIGLIGAGAFARGVLLPALRHAGLDQLVSVASASGLSARRLAERAGFQKAVPGPDAVIDDPDVSLVVVASPHDSHAELVTRALRAGKDVFCEKPLALTIDELDEVEAAWRAAGRVLFVGFNRRWSEPVRLVRDHVAGVPGPLVMTYRVNAGRLPEKHWYHDRRQGGRLVGEVCHFVDTCAAIAGSDPVDVRALGSGAAETMLHEDVVLALRFADGSLATISYASDGHHSTEKERIEVLGRGRSAIIVDFREVHLDGEAQPAKAFDKGHRAEAEALAKALRGDGETDTDHAATAAIASMRASLLALAALTGEG